MKCLLHCRPERFIHYGMSKMCRGSGSARSSFFVAAQYVAEVDTYVISHRPDS